MCVSVCVVYIYMELDLTVSLESYSLNQRKNVDVYCLPGVNKVQEFYPLKICYHWK